MKHVKYIRSLSISYFNRRLHDLLTELWQLADLLGDVLAQGTVFIIDTMPPHVCKLAWAMRCKKVQGRAFYGYCFK